MQPYGAMFYALAARVDQQCASHVLFAVYLARLLAHARRRASAAHSVPESLTPSPTPTDSENPLSTISAPRPLHQLAVA